MEEDRCLLRRSEEDGSRLWGLRELCLCLADAGGGAVGAPSASVSLRGESAQQRAGAPASQGARESGDQPGLLLRVPVPFPRPLLFGGREVGKRKTALEGMQEPEPKATGPRPARKPGPVQGSEMCMRVHVCGSHIHAHTRARLASAVLRPGMTLTSTGWWWSEPDCPCRPEPGQQLTPPPPPHW